MRHVSPDGRPLLGVLPSLAFLLSSVDGDDASAMAEGSVSVEFTRVDNFIPVQTQIQAAVAHILSRRRQEAASPPLSVVGIVAPDFMSERYDAFLRATLAEERSLSPTPPTPPTLSCLLFNSHRLMDTYRL